MIIVNSVTPTPHPPHPRPSLLQSFLLMERVEKLQGLSGCKNPRSDIVIPAGWPSGVCLKGEGRRKKKTGPGNWIVSPCQVVLALPPPSLQQHVLFSASLFSVTHIAEACAAQLSFRSLKHEAERSRDTTFLFTPESGVCWETRVLERIVWLSNVNKLVWD